MDFGVKDVLVIVSRFVQRRSYCQIMYVQGGDNGFLGKGCLSYIIQVCTEEEPLSDNVYLVGW